MHILSKDMMGEMMARSKTYPRLLFFFEFAPFLDWLPASSASEAARSTLGGRRAR